MAHVISFRTAKFDVSTETPNPINRIAGESVLNWLREELAKSQYRSTKPDMEDWGWYMNIDGSRASYMVGASADAESSSPDVEWVVQVHKSLTFKDKFLGRNELAPDDPLCALIDSIVRTDGSIDQVSVDRDD